MGRYRKPDAKRRTIGVRFTEDEAVEVEALTRRVGTSCSEVIRAAVQEFLRPAPDFTPAVAASTLTHTIICGPVASQTMNAGAGRVRFVPADVAAASAPPAQPEG